MKGKWLFVVFLHVYLSEIREMRDRNNDNSTEKCSKGNKRSLEEHSYFGVFGACKMIEFYRQMGWFR